MASTAALKGSGNRHPRRVHPWTMAGLRREVRCHSRPVHASVSHRRVAADPSTGAATVSAPCRRRVVLSGHGNAVHPLPCRTLSCTRSHVGVCSRLHSPGSLSQVASNEHGNAFDIGSVQRYQFLPFSARPLHGFSSQNSTESEKDGGDTEGKGLEDEADSDSTAAGNGSEGSQGSGGNGGKPNWDGYENYLLYLLTEHRKAESAENCKLLEENCKLRTELQTFRTDTFEKIYKVELLVSKIAVQILMGLVCLMFGAVQYIFSLTPAGKALKERIKMLSEGTAE